MEESRGGQDEDDCIGGLLCGITPYHIRLLVDDPWEGGRGLSATSVGDLTLDQIYMLLVDRKVLLAKSRKGGGVRMAPQNVSAKADKDGMVRGRAADGTPIKGRVGGKSLARQLMEAEQKKADKKRRRQRRRDRKVKG